MREGFFAQYWKQKKAKACAGHQEQRIPMTFVSGRLQVIVPFNPLFVQGAKDLYGKWRSRSGMWSFRRTAEPQVLKLIHKCFPHHTVITKHHPE